MAGKELTAAFPQDRLAWEPLRQRDLACKLPAVHF